VTSDNYTASPRPGSPDRPALVDCPCRLTVCAIQDTAARGALGQGVLGLLCTQVPKDLRGFRTSVFATDCSAIKTKMSACRGSARHGAMFAVLFAQDPRRTKTTATTADDHILHGGFSSNTADGVRFDRPSSLHARLVALCPHPSRRLGPQLLISDPAALVVPQLPRPPSNPQASIEMAITY
jgi:hypothetical protein